MSTFPVDPRNLFATAMEYVSSVSVLNLGPWELALGAGTCMVTGVLGYHTYLCTSFSGEAPVKWSTLPLLGDALNMGHRPLEFLMRCAEEYGEIFGLVVGGNRLFLITDPHSNDLIVKANAKQLSTHEFHNQVLRNFFGVSETTLSTHEGGMDDSLMRAWYSKYLYSDQGLSSLTERMQSYLHHKLDQEVASTTGSKTVDMYAWLSAFIFEASLAALLTHESPTLSPELLAHFNAFDKALPLALAGCPVSYLSAAAKGRQAMYSVAQDASDRRGETCTLMQKRFHLFQTLLDKGAMASGDDLAMQLAIMWASVGNTIPTAFWLVYFLTAEGEASEDVRAAVLAEVSSGHTTGTDGCVSFSQDKLTSMLTLDACITETLRLCSGSMIMREVMTRDVKLTLSSGNQYSFRKGDRVGICPPLAHLDAELFPQPQAFLPRRWLPEGADVTAAEVVAAAQGRLPMGSLSKGGKALASASAFLPFGGGASLCPGRRFARNEIKALVAVLLLRFDMRVTLSPAGETTNGRPSFDGSRAGLGIFPPAHSPLLTVTPRK